MAMNRLDRDTILNRALDLADSSVLDAKERPDGSTIVAAAYSIGWLQEVLDLFAKRFPFSLNLTSTAVTIAENDTDFTVPSDFILDYKNGLGLADDQGRLIRKSLNFILNQLVGTTASPVRGAPAYYVVKGNTIQFSPKANKAYTAALHYYQLPAVLTGTDVPYFPDDYILVRYVWLCAQEWFRMVQVGTALAYAEARIADLQKAGIGAEAEVDQIELDRDTFGERQREEWFTRVD